MAKRSSPRPAQFDAGDHPRRGHPRRHRENLRLRGPASAPSGVRPPSSTPACPSCSVCSPPTPSGLSHRGAGCKAGNRATEGSAVTAIGWSTCRRAAPEGADRVVIASATGVVASFDVPAGWRSTRQGRPSTRSTAPAIADGARHDRRGRGGRLRGGGRPDGPRRLGERQDHPCPDDRTFSVRRGAWGPRRPSWPSGRRSPARASGSAPKLPRAEGDRRRLRQPPGHRHLRRGRTGRDRAGTKWLIGNLGIELAPYGGGPPRHGRRRRLDGRGRRPDTAGRPPSMWTPGGRAPVSWRTRCPGWPHRVPEAAARGRHGRGVREGYLRRHCPARPASCGTPWSWAWPLHAGPRSSSLHCRGQPGPS